jgi:hypothetical protein
LNIAKLRSIFIIRRERWTITWLGWVLFLAIPASIVLLGLSHLYTFLAINEPLHGDYLVVEGWMPTASYREAASAYRAGQYKKVIAAGVMHEDGGIGDERNENFGDGKLKGYGVPGEAIVTASSSAVQRDRTYHAAMAVKEWLRKERVNAASIDVVTLGPHARRSRLLYQIALGDDVKVGVISVDDWRIDPKAWWNTSEGARTVITEAIGYAYARVLFSP